MEQTQQPQKTWWGRHWKWVVPVGCVVPVLFCSGLILLIFSAVFGMIKGSQPYTQSLTAAQANAQVQTALGTPIEPALLVTGNIQLNNANGFADIQYQITGPKGSATVYVVGNKTAGTWTYTTMAVEIQGANPQRIDLQTTPGSP